MRLERRTFEACTVLSQAATELAAMALEVAGMPGSEVLDTLTLARFRLAVGRLLVASGECSIVMVCAPLDRPSLCSEAVSQAAQHVMAAEDAIAPLPTSSELSERANRVRAALERLAVDFTTHIPEVP